MSGQRKREGGGGKQERSERTNERTNKALLARFSTARHFHLLQFPATQDQNVDPVSEGRSRRAETASEGHAGGTAPYTLLQASGLNLRHIGIPASAAPGVSGFHRSAAPGGLGRTMKTQENPLL